MPGLLAYLNWFLFWPQHYSAAHGSPQESSSTAGGSSSSSSSSGGTPLSLEGAPADQQEATHGSHQAKEEVDITFTATTSASGTLLIGSSRGGRLGNTAVI
jgi:hypothetical protein